MPVIDAHAHYDPRMLDLPSALAKMDRVGVDKVALIPCMNDPLPHTPEALLTLLRSILMSPLWRLGQQLVDAFYTPDGHLKLRGEVYKIYDLPDNNSVAEAMKSYPDRFLGWIFLNPKVMDDPVQELERWRQVPGFIGVKLHPHWHHYPLRDALPIARRCEELDLPILVHLGFGDAGEWGTLVDPCPKLRMLFAHAGMPFFWRLWGEVRCNPNLFVDVSSPYLSERLVRAAIHTCGAHKVLYGTDAPYGFPGQDHSYDYAHIKRWVERAPETSLGIERMLGTNVERLLSEQR